MENIERDLAAIEARANDPFGTSMQGIGQVDEDRTTLLALVREQQATMLAQAEELETAEREYDDWYLRHAATQAAQALREVLK